MACVVMEPTLSVLGHPAPFFMLGCDRRAKHRVLFGQVLAAPLEVAAD